MSGGKTTAAEVKVKLVVDGNAKAQTEHVKEGMTKIQKGIAHVKANWKDMAGSVARGAATLAVGGIGLVATAAAAAAGGIYHLGKASSEAFGESAVQVREVASALAMVDRSGTSFIDLKAYASELKDEMEELAIKTGETDDTMVKTFINIVERGGKSVEAAKALTEEMAYAEKAFEGGPEAISEGFEMIEAGMIRAKNPLVQMISATGTLKGNAKSVAEQMKKMSVEDQMKVAEKAIGTMAAKMKGVPLTMGQMKKSMGVAFGNLFETAGESINRGLSPIIGKVHKLFLDNQGPLQKAAQIFGERIEQALSLVVPIIEDIENAFKENADDIDEVVKFMRDTSKEMLDYFEAHKEGIGNFFENIVHALVFGAKVIKEMVENISWIMGKVAKFMAGSEAGKALGMDKYLQDDARRGGEKKLKESVDVATPSGGEFGEQAVEAKKKYAQTMIDAGMEQIEAQAEADKAWKRAADAHANSMASVQKFRDGSIYGDANSFVKAWTAANASQDEGAKEYVANFLAQNRELVKAMVEKGPEILGQGFGDLIKKLESMHSGIADELKAKRPKLDPGKTSITQNFNGAITIKQDFRDQDPDKVAVVFRRDLEALGTNRGQSRFAPAFGF